MVYNKKHRQLQRQHQRDLTLAGLALVVALACIGGGIAWVIVSIWRH